jgi:YVTN family beta-propeller protein
MATVRIYTRREASSRYASEIFIASLVLCGLGILAGCSATGGKEPKTESKNGSAPRYFKVDGATAGILKGTVRFTGKKPARRPIDMAGEPACVEAHHGRAYDEPAIDTATNTVTGSVEVGQRPWGIALSPDGKTLYSANGPSDDISVVDVATNTVVKKIKAGTSPWGVIALDR